MSANGAKPAYGGLQDSGLLFLPLSGKHSDPFVYRREMRFLYCHYFVVWTRLAFEFFSSWHTFKGGKAHPMSKSSMSPWHEIEAIGFLGAPQRTASGGLTARIIGRMRRRTRVESLISGGVLHTARVALYVCGAYVLKMLFGINIVLQHMH